MMGYRHRSPLLLLAIHFPWAGNLSSSPVNLNLPERGAAFEDSIRMRFGTMGNDVTALAYCHQEGRNELVVTLKNQRGSNHGGWAFAMRCGTADGEIMNPGAK